MDSDQLDRAVAEALSDRQLLTHPFYRRWEAGALTEGELAAYAGQYRHIERALPEVLGGIAAGLPLGDARELVEANLADECGVPEAHTSLFEGFAEAAGAAGEMSARPATAALVALQREAARRDPVAALAMVAAYEVQAAGIASSKADGLRAHYGFGGAGTRFWDVHAAMEADHAAWSLDALAALEADPATVRRAAADAADAWWAFLDEREAMAPAGAGC